MRRKPTDFLGVVYIDVSAGPAFIRQADKLVTFSAEFVAATRERGLVKVLRLPDNSQILRIEAVNKTLTYQVVFNESVGCYYGELMEGDT